MKSIVGSPGCAMSESALVISGMVRVELPPKFGSCGNDRLAEDTLTSPGGHVENPA